MCTCMHMRACVSACVYMYTCMSCVCKRETATKRALCECLFNAITESVSAHKVIPPCPWECLPWIFGSPSFKISARGRAELCNHITPAYLITSTGKFSSPARTIFSCCHHMGSTLDLYAFTASGFASHANLG